MGFRGIPEQVYCSLDKIDLAATVDGSTVAIQTDHRSAAEIEAEPELSVLFAMARVINARGQAAQVHYVVGDPPALLVDALTAAGAVISEAATQLTRREAPALSEPLVGEIADRAFRDLAHKVAAQVGTRDLAMALRMLEDQTLTAPPERGTPAYWTRILELAALTGELLRGKSQAWGAGRWAQTDRALVPFGFELNTAADTTVMFPTNRAQRLIDDGRDESLFKLLVALDETMQRPPDATTGRLMPSLRDRRNVELDEIVWQALLPEHVRADLPIVVIGIDGESTFGMIRREALQRTSDEAIDEALRNLAAEQIEIAEVQINELSILAITGSFYAAEKLLDRELMRRLHDHLDREHLIAAAPSRGVLLVAAHEPAVLARFANVVRARHDEAGGRAISPAVLTVEDGRVVGFLRDTVQRADTAPVRADTADEHGQAHDPPRKPGLLRRLLGRK